MMIFEGRINQKMVSLIGDLRFRRNCAWMDSEMNKGHYGHVALFK
jgi:hypothetical protein